MDVVVNEETNSTRDLKDIELCKSVARVLLDHYPDHMWHVEANSDPGVRMIDIKLNYVDKLGLLPKFGFKMMIDNAWPNRIMLAGGELLERYRLARGRASQYAAFDAMKNGIDRHGEIR